MNNLVIVESPTKAKTLSKFLGSDYRIEASMGHIRDLPKSELGVDIGGGFQPQYVIPRDKRKRVNELKKLAEGSKVLWLATDPDREGEAIAWHIQNILSNKKSGQEIHRVVFHEITPEAIKEAFETPRHLDLKLVDAQQARRVLDRLVGYKLSPLLWQKVRRGLSAGRVQSVALRLIVEREREITAFKPEEYWTIRAEFKASDAKNGLFWALLVEHNGKKIEIKNQAQAESHLQFLQTAQYRISQVTKKAVKRYPFPPFTTSTLQQTAANRLGLSAKKTMMVAQALYERGFITYMRTDSVNLSHSAITAVRSYIAQMMGTSYLPTSPRIYKSKSKNAQEAHEAIRPTDVRVTIDQIKSVAGFTRDHSRVYELIWKRFLACQMSEAVLDQTTLDVTASSSHPEQAKRVEGSENSNLQLDPSLDSSKTSRSGLIAQDDNGTYLFRSIGSIVKFEGWLKLYGKEPEGLSDKSSEEGEDKNQVLPEVSENQPTTLQSLNPEQHFTQPPPRYNEASLIKKLEELGIGRPSTYAPILSTIQDRYYVEKIERKFVPTTLGFAVTDFLMEYFADIVDYTFTAQMEDELDEVARGEREWQPVIQEFYTPFEQKIDKTTRVAEKVKVAVEKVNKQCPECGKDLVVRIGKFGKFLACSGFPNCKHTEALAEQVNAKCPDCGGEIVVRRTKKGKTFYGCKNWPGCKFASWTKPKASS